MLGVGVTSSFPGRGQRPGTTEPAQSPQCFAPRPTRFFRWGQAWLIEHRTLAARRSAGGACATRGFRRGWCGGSCRGSVCATRGGSRRLRPWPLCSPRTPTCRAWPGKSAASPARSRRNASPVMRRPGSGLAGLGGGGCCTARCGRPASPALYPVAFGWVRRVDARNTLVRF